MQINYVLRPDWRYQKAEGKFPIRLWVSYLDQRANYQTTFEVSKEDYEKLSTGKNLSVELRQIRDDLRKIQTSIDNYLANVTEFEFDAFQTNFINYNPLFVQRKKELLQYLIKAKLRHKKIGTATHYQTTYNAFKRFRGNVTFRQVITSYLDDFKYYMLDKKASLNTYWYVRKKYAHSIQ